MNVDLMVVALTAVLIVNGGDLVGIARLVV